MHKLRPSDAPRWTVCAAAPAFTEGMEDRGSEAAALGTAKHTLAEMLASMDFAPASTMIGMEIDEFTVDAEFAEQVDWALMKAQTLIEAEEEVRI